MATLKTLERLRGARAVFDMPATIFDDATRELNERFIELPLDADGVPWHVDDLVTDEYGTRATVIAVGDDTLCCFDHVERKPHVVTASLYCHYHKLTVEAVLEELLDGWPECETPEDERELKERIATKLRLARDE